MNGVQTRSSRHRKQQRSNALIILFCVPVIATKQRSLDVVGLNILLQHLSAAMLLTVCPLCAALTQVTNWWHRQLLDTCSADREIRHFWKLEDASTRLQTSTVKDCFYLDNNNGFWIGWLDLLTSSFTITPNYNQFTITHNTFSAQFWSDVFGSEPRLTWKTTVFSSSLSSTDVSWLISSAVADLVQSCFTNICWFTNHSLLIYEWITNESSCKTMRSESERPLI
jgi:hypothetical protein